MYKLITFRSINLYSFIETYQDCNIQVCQGKITVVDVVHQLPLFLFVQKARINNEQLVELPYVPDIEQVIDIKYISVNDIFFILVSIFQFFI